MNLRAAVDLISAAAAKSSEGAGIGGGSASGGDKKRRGDTDRNRRGNPSQAQAVGGDRGSVSMEDAWAIEVTSMKQFGTLKGILESHPDRFPSPTDEG